MTMDISKKKILPKGALAIILHTCEFPEGNTWAKRITKQAIRVLGSQDEVGVLGYGMTGDYWIFQLTPAGRLRKSRPQNQRRPDRRHARLRTRPCRWVSTA